MSSILVTPVTYTLVVRPRPSFSLVVGGGGGGGGSGTLTEVQVNGTGLIVTDGTGPIVQLELDFGTTLGKVADGAAVATAQSTANTAVTNAATAQSTANTAVTNAAAAQSTANTGVTNAAAAQSTANTALANAATAQSTANTAVTNAATAQTAANTAQTTANTASSILTTHILDLANPHATTKTQVGLSNVTNDAQWASTLSGQINALTTKTAASTSDVLAIEDSAALFVKKKVLLGQLQSAGAFLGAQSLNVPPLTAGSIDDEFDSTTLNAAWIFRDLTAGVTRTPTATTPLTPYTDITGATTVPKYALHTNGRRSHLLMQTTVTGPMSCILVRPYTWSAGKFLWARVGTVVTSSINVCGIILLADSGGVPDTNNYVLIVYGGGGGTGLFSRVRAAGVNTDVTQNLTAGTQTWPYLGIENSIGSLGASARWWTYGFNDDGGQTILSAGVANSFTPAWVGFDFSNVHGTPTIFSADFIRESSGHPLYVKV